MVEIPVSEPEYWSDACAALSVADPLLRGVIATHRRDVLRGSGDAFRTLLNAVVGQQISVSAADSIWSRVVAAFPNLNPAVVRDAQVEALRRQGLSRPKAEYIRGIAAAFVDGRVDPAQWTRWSDAQVHTQLLSLRGVGPWTADMMLIFHLRRPDVLPLGDVALVNAAARLCAAPDVDVSVLPQRREWLRAHAERWRPWRTVATWYIWRTIDADPVIY